MTHPEDRRLVLEIDEQGNEAKILHVNAAKNGIIVGKVVIGGGACRFAQKRLCIMLLEDMVKSANEYRHRDNCGKINPKASSGNARTCALCGQEITNEKSIQEYLSGISVNVNPRVSVRHLRFPIKCFPIKWQGWFT